MTKKIEGFVGFEILDSGIFLGSINSTSTI